MSNQIPPTDLFSGIEGAQASFGANYERPGHYVERIDRFKAGVTRKNEAFLAVEKTVIHVYDNDEGKGHKAGENVTHMLMKKHDSFLGNVKAMISKILGCSPEEVDQASCMALCGDDQPLAGMLIEVKNVNVVTKSGGTFTRINYQREVPAQEVLDSNVLSDHILNLHFEGGALLARMAEAQNPQAPA